jgi:hypothetical protein
MRQRSFAEFTLSEANGLRMTSQTSLSSARGKSDLQMSEKVDHFLTSESSSMVLYPGKDIALSDDDKMLRK